MKKAIEHLKTHQTFPATKAQIVATCNNLEDIDQEDKQWFIQTLPEGTYNSAKDVLAALV